MGRQSRAVLLAAAVLLTVSACGGSDTDAGAQIPRATESAASGAEPSPSPSEDSAVPAGVPTEPPARPQDERSEEGAKAFAEYVGDTWWYTLNSFDPKPLQALSPPDDECDWCGRVIGTARELAPIARQEGVVRVPANDTSYRDGRVAQDPADDDLWTVVHDIKMPPAKVVDRDTGEVRERLDGEGWTPFWVDMRWKDGTWELVRFRFDVEQ